MTDAALLWLSPAAADARAAAPARDELAAATRPLAQRYVERACRPLLATPEAALDHLPRIVKRLARESLSVRLELLQRLADSLRAPEDAEVLVEGTCRAALTTFARDAEAHFERDAIGCFELGIRTHRRTVLRLLRRSEPQREHVLAGVGFRLLELGSCLDLCVSSVLLWLGEAPMRARARVPQELCFHVKELALAQGGLVGATLTSCDGAARGADSTDEDRLDDVALAERSASEAFAYL